MNKISIDKTLSKGSPKQRAILLANHIAEVNLEGKGFLTDPEFQSLTNSFKTDQEIEAYNRYRKIYDRVRNFIPNLSQMRFTYAYSVERLDKYISLKRCNYDIEDIINNLLDFIPNKKNRDKAISQIKMFSNLRLMRSFEVDTEGYIKAYSHNNLLDKLITDAREKSKVEQVDLKTGITLIKDYISETGFNVRVYSAYIKEMENWAKSKKNFAIDLTKTIKEKPHLREILEKEVLEKSYDEVEIDQELYNSWRKSFFEEV